MGSVVQLPKRRKLPDYGDAHIPAGEYSASLMGYETWARCRGWEPRVVVVFGIVDTSVAANVVIPAYYRVLSISGKYKFNVGTKSRLYRDLGRMMDRRPPQDHIPVNELDHCLYRVVVRDVVQDQFKLDLGAVRYSVINCVLGRENQCS